ncbi:SOS response-associated peptidase [Sphingomonas lutea]|uniref:Abasic site processing protein n=1 Tax=Sphingomonas lutea TaxID=1045317 RepID=A0A7G9SK93_9SPHN|nr:SOS response-associated peptidase [Sphingomonas lutea]QNN68268.1 SOS response-associated peptidase [Sphingomonas lutea]
MCNLYTQTKSVDEIAGIFRDVQMPLSFPEGVPNLEPRDVRITDQAPIVRAGALGYELVVRRWSWPAPNGKPVYNFRSEGRDFKSGRCLIVADGFYEFTAPADPKQRRKDRWLFTASGAPMLAIAGLMRTVPGIGQAFTMLTTEPGPDVAPYHSRQVAVLDPADWGRWLDHSGNAPDLLRALPAGTLTVETSMAAPA